jgi:hypothetical protein
VCATFPRFGSALNLNIHFHMLFLDGVCNSANFVSLWVAALLVALSKVPSGSTQRDSRPAHFVSSFRFVLSWSDPNKIAGFDLVLPRD